MRPAAATEKTLFQLSYPLLLNALVGMAVTLADTVILSSYSENTAAAVSFANQILLVAFDLSAMLAGGAVVLVSRRLGAGDSRGARQVASAAILGNGLTGAGLGAVIFCLAPLMVGAVNCPAEIFDDATIYLRVGAFTILFNGAMLAATATLRGYGETRTLLVFGLAAYTVYLLSAYLLIFGWGWIPELGVLGSALATLLVRVLAVLVLLVLFIKRLKQARQKNDNEAAVPPNNRWCSFTGLPGRLRELFALSWPASLDNLAYGFYQLILVSYIAQYDVATLLSRTFTLTLTAVLTVVLMAISQANEVMLGYRWGAGRKDEIHGCVIRSAAVSTALTIAAACAIYWFRGPLIGLFTNDSQIHALAGQLLAITIAVQPFSCLNTILYFTLKVRGDVIMPVVGTQVMMWGLSVPVAYLLAVEMRMSVVGLWWVLLMEEALKAVFLTWRYAHLTGLLRGDPSN